MVRHKLFGVNVDILDEEEMYERILALSELDKPSQIVLLDTILLIKAKLNRELFNTINSSDLIIPVSRGVKNALSFLGCKINQFFNPFTFTIRLLSCFSEYNKVIYMLGSTKKIIEKTEKNIKESFPGIRLMGTYHTNYKKDFEKNLITAIYKISPALLIVSMKKSKQEKWISKNKNSLKKGVIVGVESFVEDIGAKLLSPQDRLSYNVKKLLKNIFGKPIKYIYYNLYVIYLIGYKIFRFDR